MDANTLLKLLQGVITQTDNKGMDDAIPANLSEGEYVIDAETVAALGDGSSEAGAEVLDKFREAIRMMKKGTDEQAPRLNELLSEMING